ncbi:hypothetical protein QT969_25980, partial [Rhodococcus sp. CSLK01-03]
LRWKLPGPVGRRLLRSRPASVRRRHPCGPVLVRGTLLRRIRLGPRAALLGARRLRRVRASLRRGHPPVGGRRPAGTTLWWGTPHRSRSPRRRGTCRSVPVRRHRPFALRVVVGGTHVLISNR